MSANALLMTYIGGGGAFAGPGDRRGADRLLQSWVSLLSNSWLVYAGVPLHPHGHVRPRRNRRARHDAPADLARGPLGRLAGPYARLIVPSLLVAVGFVLVIELCSFLTIGAAQGKSLTLSGSREPRSGTPGSPPRCLLAGAVSGCGWRHAGSGRLGRRSPRDQGDGEAGVSATSAAPACA